MYLRKESDENCCQAQRNATFFLIVCFLTNYDVTNRKQYFKLIRSSVRKTTFWGGDQVN